MQRISPPHRRALIVALVGMLAAGPALAEKPSWAGGGKGEKGHGSERSEGSDRQHGQDRDHGDGESQGNNGPDRRAAAQHFDDQHRLVVREYFDGQFQSGRCPPGLAKKHNGCMPPGHARKWAMGRPLPRNVIFYEVPQPLVVQIGLPPRGYRYVRVAGDILMIATGTALVVDAIQDLGR
jgi:Ni/Co efflux regulator RcnB